MQPARISCTFIVLWTLLGCNSEPTDRPPARSDVSSDVQEETSDPAEDTKAVDETGLASADTVEVLGDAEGVPPNPDPNPDPISPQLMVQKQGEGRVQITTSDGTVECGKGCAEWIGEASADPTTLHAHPQCGWSFQGWSGDCSGQTAQTLQVVSDTTCIATFVYISDEEHLQAGSTGLTFATTAGPGWHAKTLSAGGPSGLTWELSPRSLWSMELWSVADYDVAMPGDSAQEQRCYVIESANERALEITSLGASSSEGDVFDVRIRVRAVQGEALIRFGAHVTPTNDSLGIWGLGRINVPVLDFKDPGETSELYLPACGGIKLTHPAESARRSELEPADPGGPIDYQYPDIYNMRFSAVADTKQGMLAILSTDDSPERRFEIKHFLAWGTDAKDIRLSVGRLPSDPHVQRELAISGESTLTAMNCTNPAACWHDASVWFRNKVDAENYLTRGPMENEPDNVQTLLGLDAAIVVGHYIDENNPTPPDFPGYLTYLESTRTWLGLDATQLSTTWYDWHNNVFDTDLPAHLPALPDYVGTVHQARSLGYHVLPYTTPTAWAYDLPSFATLNVGSKWGIVNQHGKPHEYEHVGGQLHQAVDFAVPSLGQYFSDNLYKTLFKEHLVDGLYLDFFPRPARCFASNHGHEVGGGASFINGVREFLELLRQQANELAGGSLLIAEAMGDYSIDYASLGSCYRYEPALIPVKDTRLGHIPLFDVAFRDITQMGSLGIMDMPGWPYYAGANYLKSQGDPTAVPLVSKAFRLELGWSFAAGHQLILLRRPIGDPATGHSSLRDDPSFLPLMELYKTFVTMRARPDVKALVVQGKMAVPPEFLDREYLDTPSVFPHIMPDQGGAVPTVFVYAFQNQKGDLAFTLFNWTDTDQPIEFLIHPDRYGMAYDATSNTLADTWRVTAHNGTDSVVLANDLNQAQDQAWLAPKFENFQPNQPWILLYEKQ